MAASPLKIVTVAGTDLSSVHGHQHSINKLHHSNKSNISSNNNNNSNNSNLNHHTNHQLHHHVTFNLAPPPPPQQQQQQQLVLSPRTSSNGLPSINNNVTTDSSSQTTEMTILSPTTAARRKMSVMHTDPLLVVQETHHLNGHCLSQGTAADTHGADTVTTFSVTTPTLSIDLSKCNKVISNDGSVVCSVVSSSSTPYDAGDIRVSERAEEVDVAKPSTIYGPIATEIGGLIERQKSKESPRKASPRKSLQLSPKDLEEHISKIISQNAAIVETDPLYRKVSRDSKASTRRFSSFELGRSKLQTALLAGGNPRRVSSVEVPAWSRESNPEGSIIKDLLLKSRVPFPPPPAASDSKDTFACNACNTAFSSMEHLQVHTVNHCPRSTEIRNDENHVSVIKRSEATPLKKRKFSEPAYLHSSKSESNWQPQQPLSSSSVQLSVPVIVATPATPELFHNEVFADRVEPVVSSSMFTSTTTTSTCTTANTTSCSAATVIKPARPTSLEIPTQPSVLIGSNLISPDTPRPLKAFRQTYMNGHAYTYLGLKVSTRSTYCCIYRPQPMFVLQETDPRLSMYSNWIMYPYKDDLKLGVEPIGLLDCADHRQWKHDQMRPLYSVASSQGVRSSQQAPLHITHSSYWLAKMATKKHSITSDYSSFKDDLDSLPPSRKQSTVTEPGSELDSSSIFTDESAVEETSQDEEWRLGSSERQKRVKICEGGYKSNEDYTYVRGRGRGKYVCEECGIRCKKPSMLKKHIRTHTDLRPYFCKHCEFAFKTKGNLTKHMKSKAHHKKCVELGIVPVPTVIDDSHVDHEQLAKQEQQRREHSSESEGDDDDDDHETESDSEGEHFTSNNNNNNNNNVTIKPAKAVNNAIMLTEKGLNASTTNSVIALPAAPHHTISLGSTPSPNLVQLGLTPQRIVQKMGQPATVVNGKGGLPVTESREQEAARSLLDLAKLNCNNSQLQQQQQQPDILESHESTKAVQFNSEALNKETIQRFSPLVDKSPMENRKRSNVGESPGFAGIQKGGVDSQYVEPPRKKSSCVRPPQIDTIEEETLVEPHRGFLTLQPTIMGSHGQPVESEDCKQARENNNMAYPARSPIHLESRSRSISMEQQFVAGLEVEQQQQQAQQEDQSRFASLDQAAVRVESVQVLPSGIVRDQPMDLRVGSTRARRLEILPGGIVSQPPQSFARDPHTMQRMAIGSISGQNHQFTPQGENVHDNLVGGCMSYGQSGGKLGEAGQQHPQSPVQQQQQQQNLPPPPPFNQGVIAPQNNGMPQLVVPKQEYIPNERDRDTPQTMTPLQVAQNAGLTWSQSIPTSLPLSSSSHLGGGGGGGGGGMSSMGAPGGEEGKCVCNICHKSFPKMSQLRMHVNIHYFERPFRCDACAKSFRTRGHLQKHKRSVSHYNRVNMNLTFGTPTADNPRPFKCDDCKIAFRIHGHLAKHLRSKAHIMKLECLGKLPFGMYAELERSGINLSDIDTTDCENSLESLQVLAQRLYQQEPCSLRWKDAGGSGDPGSEPEDDGIEAPLPPMQQALGIVTNELGSSQQAAPQTAIEQRRMDPQPTPSAAAMGNSVVSSAPQQQQHHHLHHHHQQQQPQHQALVIQHNQQLHHSTQESTAAAAEYVSEQQSVNTMMNQMISHAAPHGPHSASLLPPPPPSSHHMLSQDMQHHHRQPQPRSSCTCHLCGKVLKSAKSLQVHLHTEHADEQSKTPAPAWLM